jgi:hypothetical protein
MPCGLEPKLETLSEVRKSNLTTVVLLGFATGYNRTMIRAHVDKDGRLLLPAGRSIAELLDKDVLLQVAPTAEESMVGVAGHTDTHPRQGVFRQFTDERDGQSLRFDGGVLVFDAGVENEAIDAEMIEGFIQQEREERLQFPE